MTRHLWNIIWNIRNQGLFNWWKNLDLKKSWKDDFIVSQSETIHYLRQKLDKERSKYDDLVTKHSKELNSLQYKLNKVMSELQK